MQTGASGIESPTDPDLLLTYLLSYSHPMMSDHFQVGVFLMSENHESDSSLCLLINPWPLY